MVLNGAAQRFGCLNYHEAIQVPSQAHCVYLDCLTDDCGDFFGRLSDFSSLETLEVQNLNRDLFPADMKGMKRLNALILNQCPALDFNSLMRRLATIPALKELVLDNNGIAELPKSIGLLQHLSRLVIRNNENFNIERAILQLNHLSALRELALPLNQISDLPDNVVLLRQIEVLDLSDNQLTDLPARMRELDSLEDLNLEKNVFVNTAQSLEKLAGLNLQYLSVDPGLSDTDRDRLQRLFPQANIVVIDEVETGEEAIVLPGEAMGAVDDDSLSMAYQTIMVGGENFQALSDAYLHYARIFDNPIFKSDFDSLLFEERYLDTSYANVWITQPWKTYNNIRLYCYKDGAKGEVWFDFHPDVTKNDVLSADPYITKYNPELLGFLGLKWVYQGPLSKKQFIHNYIKTENGPRYWMDVRIYFNEDDHQFTLELKDRDGFTKIPVSLRNRSRTISAEKTQESYNALYEKYIKALDGRRKRFHKRLVKDKSAFDVTLERTVLSAWENFRLTYMSPAEQRMSRADWLEYYDKVIADETEALNNAAPELSLLQRSLVLSKFEEAPPDTLLSDTSHRKVVYGVFCDEQQNRLAVTRGLVVNLDDKLFRVFEGSLGLKNIQLCVSLNKRYAIIADIRNGDVGVMSPILLDEMALRQNMERVFALKRVSRKISSIRQIRELIGF